MVHLPHFSKFHNPFFGERVPVTLKIPNLDEISWKISKHGSKSSC